MKVVKEFSKFAHEYNKYNVIQKEVAKKLCASLEKKYYKNILDLGAGNGEVYQNFLHQNIQFQAFIALDFSAEMLEVHPSNKKVKKVCLDFNSKKFFTFFKKNQFDVLISSSALQWSNNLSAVLTVLSHFSNEFHFSFFTSNTFKTLHKTVNIKSPIYAKDEILEALDKIFIYDCELVTYTLVFDSVHEMLRYIKKSGVSAGVEQLHYREMKALMLNYPLNYLEFEVIFVKGKLK